MAFNAVVTLKTQKKKTDQQNTRKNKDLSIF